MSLEEPQPITQADHSALARVGTLTRRGSGVVRLTRSPEDVFLERTTGFEPATPTLARLRGSVL
jgi:hypothetical protein